jgi:integration host factor subunit alpha
MATTKARIVQSISQDLALPTKKSTQVVETLLEILKRTLQSGDDVLISGFGKFSVRHKAERKGRNPATGSDLKLRPRKVVTFKCSGKLRRRINGD